MRGIRMVFILGMVALLGAAICLAVILLVPEQKIDKETENSTMIEEAEDSKEELLKKDAEKEVKRFKESYGMDIPLEEMVKQLLIRSDYEEKYGKSYPLEDVFNVSGAAEEDGDAGNASYTDSIEKIQRYIELYNIDESRYASMTTEEELRALEVEYGPLPDEVGP